MDRKQSDLIIPFTKTDSPMKVKVLEVLDITREEDIVDTAMKHGYDSIFVVDAATNEIIEASIFDEENVIAQEIDPPMQEEMEKTARRWEKPKVYSNVLYKGIEGKSILNFGSGSEEIVKASKGLREISEKNTVTNYDFNYNPDALEKGPYDLVMASNVLNVQPNIDTLNITINQITNSIREGGQVIFNLPSSGPRKGAYDNLTTSQAKDMLTQKFEEQGVRGTWKNEIFTGYKSERPPPPRISGTPTRAERIEMQGGPLSRRLNEGQIVRLLEEHGFNWEYNKAGGITAIESDNSKKHFRENTTLRTIRNWLGYYKGGQVRPMYDGGLV